MPVEVPLVVSRNASLRWDDDGRLVVQGSRSGGEPVRIDYAEIDVLGAFAAPTRPTDVLESRSQGESDPGRRARVRAGLEALIDRLHRIGVLVAAGGAITAEAGHFAKPQRHLPMLWDSVRTNAYRRVLERSAPNKVLVELGCGHGVLACLAVRAGARRVYAIEETRVIEVAREISRVNGMDDRIVFLEGNSLDVDLPELADVVYGDLIGPDPLGAGMLVSAHDAASRFLRPGGLMIPSRLTLFAVGVDSPKIANEVRTARRWIEDAERLSTTLQLDISPLVEASRAAFARAYDVYSYKELLDPGAVPSNDAGAILTRQVPISEFDLHSVHPIGGIDSVLQMPVVRGGTLNAVATYAVVHLDKEDELTTSPYAPLRPSSWGGQFLSTIPPIRVEAGETIDIEAMVTPWTSPAVSYRPVREPGSGRAASLFPS
jgi:hypothetical protein